MGAPCAAKMVGIREEGTWGVSTASVTLLMGAFLVLVHANVGMRDSHTRRGIRTSVMCCSLTPKVVRRPACGNNACQGEGDDNLAPLQGLTTPREPYWNAAGTRLPPDFGHSLDRSSRSNVVPRLTYSHQKPHVSAISALIPRALRTAAKKSFLIISVIYLRSSGKRWGICWPGSTPGGNEPHRAYRRQNRGAVSIASTAGDRRNGRGLGGS